MSNFSRCFPVGNGNMCCQHWNGSYIVFPIRNGYKKEKSPKDRSLNDLSEEENRQK